MQTETSTSTPAVTSECRLIGEAERKGYRYVTWGRDDEFFVEIFLDGTRCLGFRSESTPHRGRAELEAERWIDAKAAEPAEASTQITVAGWRLQLRDDRGGTFKVDLVDAATGETPAAPAEVGEFKGYQSRDQALAEAQEWAGANPLRVAGQFNGLDFEVARKGERWTFSVSYPLGTGDQHAKFDASLEHHTFHAATCAAQRWCGEFRIGGEIPLDRPVEVEVIERGAEAGTETKAEVAPPPAPATTPAATPSRTPPHTPPAPPVSEPPRSTDWSTVDEVWTLLQERNDLSEELTLLQVRRRRLAAEEKELKEKIAEKDLEIRNAYQRQPRQRTLPLNPAPRMEQAKVAEQAPAVVADLKHQGPEVPWAFNGVDHTIIVEAHKPDGKAALGFRAYLKGHADQTEGFDLDRSAAIEACKARASIVFADAEPGSTAIPTPPKRGRGRKAKETEEQPPLIEESPDAERVKATLRLSMNIEEAAKKLKRTERTLQKWCAENSVTISEHLGRDLGHDEPAQPAGKSKKASKRGGGRRAT